MLKSLVLASAFLVGAVLPSALQAQCASAADLAGGVRFEMAGGAFWEVRASGGQDRDVTFVWSPDFPAQFMEFARGIYLESLRSDGQSAALNIIYATPPASAPPVATAGQWQVQIETGVPGNRFQSATTYEWGRQVQQVTYGACTYDMLPMTLRGTALDGSAQTSRYAYFPQFGAVVILADPYGTQWQITGISAQ